MKNLTRVSIILGMVYTFFGSSFFDSIPRFGWFLCLFLLLGFFALFMAPFIEGEYKERKC